MENLSNINDNELLESYKVIKVNNENYLLHIDLSKIDESQGPEPGESPKNESAVGPEPGDDTTNINESSLGPEPGESPKNESVIGPEPGDDNDDNKKALSEGITERSNALTKFDAKEDMDDEDDMIRIFARKYRKLLNNAFQDTDYRCKLKVSEFDEGSRGGGVVIENIKEDFETRKRIFGGARYSTISKLVLELKDLCFDILDDGFKNAFRLRFATGSHGDALYVYIVPFRIK